jgi:predicted Rossmann fold nucleotide-binding protein DprA/Smf involved in DNA uptake
MISGSRTAQNSDYSTFEKTLDQIADITEILHGGAHGFDQFAQCYAEKRGIKTRIIRPDYTKGNGKLAPILRNKLLVSLSDAVLCFYADCFPNRTNGTMSAANFANGQKKLLKEVWTRKGLIL